MSKPIWDINDLVWSNDEGANVKIQDIHISPTSGQVVYECITIAEKPTYPLYREEDLDDKIEEEY